VNNVTANLKANMIM